MATDALPCGEPCSPIVERVARTEKAVEGLERRVGELVEWKHHSLPSVLAEIALKTTDLKDRFEEHLVVSAEKIATYDEAVKKTESLEDAINGQAGLMLVVERLSGDVRRNEAILSRVETGIDRMTNTVRSLDESSRAKATRRDTLQKLLLGSGWVIALLASIAQVLDWLK